MCAAEASPRNEPYGAKIKLLVGLVPPGVSGESISLPVSASGGAALLGSGPFFTARRLVLPLSNLPLLA